MEQVYIGFSRPSGWFEPFSWAIRLAQWTPYSHVYIRIPSTSLNRDIVYQASGLAVNFIGSQRFQSKEIIVKEFPINISPESKTKVLQFSVDSAGAPYGVKEVFGIAWVLFNSAFGRKVKNPFADGSDSFVCSEFVGDILKNDLGINLPDPENIDPKIVYNAMLKYEQGS